MCVCVCVYLILRCVFHHTHSLTTEAAAAAGPTPRTRVLSAPAAASVLGLWSSSFFALWHRAMFPAAGGEEWLFFCLDCSAARAATFNVFFWGEKTKNTRQKQDDKEECEEGTEIQAPCTIFSRHSLPDSGMSERGGLPRTGGVPSPHMQPSKPVSITSNRPVHMNLFATWEVDRSSPSCVPRYVSE